MSLLMSLPRELRDKICTYAILTPKNEPPTLNQTFDEFLEGRQVLSNPSSNASSGTAFVRYRLEKFVATSTPLLLVNHQLNAETISNMRIMEGTHDYEIDIVLLDEIMLIPTWLHVPVLTTRIDTLNVTFRISGIFDAGTDAYKAYEFGSDNGFRGGDGGPYPMVWPIYRLLERFIKVGPLGKRLNPDERKDISVKTLSINVQTPKGE